MTVQRMFRPGVLFAAVLAFLALVDSASANCRWEVSGRLREQITQGPNQQPSFFDVTTGVRVKARWSNPALCPQIGFTTTPCPWNTANWTASASDTQGNFTIASAAFPDPVCQHDREFQIEVRGCPFTTGWTAQGTVVAAAGPSGMTGLSNPAPTHSANLGTVVTTCFPDPPVELVPAEPDEPADEPPQPQTPTAVDAGPCAALRNLPQQPDFGYGPMMVPVGATNVSPDGRIRITLRQENGQPRSRRLRVVMNVANTGTRDHTPGDACPVTIAVQMNEGPDEYENSSQGATHEAQDDIDTIPRGGNRVHQVDASLRGTGPDAPGNWNQSYERVRIEVQLDSTNAVNEANEGNNRAGPYCYDATGNRFLDMGACGSADADDATKPGKPNKPAKPAKPGDGG